ncbi:MAG: histidinol dehydrogenase [Anaerolineae bacterium]
MKIRRLSQMTAAEVAALKRRSGLDIEGLLSSVKPIVEDVKARGDVALLEYTARFDGVRLSAAELKVSKEEIKQAYEKVSSEALDAFRRSARNVRRFQEQSMPEGQRPEPFVPGHRTGPHCPGPDSTGYGTVPKDQGPVEGMWLTEIVEGVLAGQKVTPIESVGLYVPGGKGDFPSVMLMLGICAKVAGVRKTVACTPPTPEGSVNSGTLVAANLAGVTDVYKVGGAQAIAALAFGTGTVPKVDKIVGPGGPYVAAAKQLVAGVVDVGNVAGPSEAIILADGGADPWNVALDLLVQGEHSEEAASLLVTHSQDLIEGVQEALPELLAELPDERRQICETVLSKYGGAVLTESLAQSIEFVNDYAPEHLQLAAQSPFAVLSRIRNAGTILLGQGTPFTFADFSLGPTNVIPTGGFAKVQSPVSVRDFLKHSSVCFVLDRTGFDSLAEGATTFAEYEGFPAHAMAVRKRRVELV